MKSLFVAVLLLVLPAASRAEDPADLADYLAGIREAGMSENARSSLLMVAMSRLGHQLITFTPGDEGLYFPSYESTTCPLRDGDPVAIQAWQDELEAARDADIEHLRPLADLDGSGFVSSAEGREFRTLYEFGLLATQLADEGRVSYPELARASGLSEAEARTRLSAYLDLLERDRGDGETLFPEPRMTFVGGE